MIKYCIMTARIITLKLEQEDGNKKYGKIKEHHLNSIVQMGLFVDGDDISLAFSLFPGNSNEHTFLKPLEQKVIDIYCQDTKHTKKMLFADIKDIATCNSSI